MPQTIEVRFKGTRRGFFHWTDKENDPRLNDAVIVEVAFFIGPMEKPAPGTLEPDFYRLGHYASEYAPILPNLSARRRMSLSGLILRSSARLRTNDSLTASPVASGSVCAPPVGSSMISSMTPKERKNARILNASRKKRVAAGSGTSVQEINKLLKMHQQMAKMMKRVGKMGAKGMMPGSGAMPPGFENFMPRR